MTEYNKLVRDKIPEIIETSGERANVRILEDGEYFRELRKKLGEEVGEYLESGDSAELADILEVVLALAGASGISSEELWQIYGKKHRERGGFEKKIFLVSKE